MAARPGGAQIVETPDVADPMAQVIDRLLPWYIGPSRGEQIFDEHEFQPPPVPMPKVHMLADAGGSGSPAMMEIAKFFAKDDIPRPQRIDLSSMPGPRGGGETTRFDVAKLLADAEPQTVNREAKRDSLASVEPSSVGRGIVQEGIGQALLLGYGDDIEGWLSIASKAGFSDAVTHDLSDITGKFRGAQARVQDIVDNPRPGDGLGAALAWLDNTRWMGRKLDEAEANPDYRKINKLTKHFGGNLDARAVRARSGGANRVYPYQEAQWRESVALPPAILSREELARFLANWQNYGPGAGL